MTRLMIPETLVGRDRIEVSGDEGHYLVRVRRHKAGDSVEVQDADGRLFRGVIERVEHTMAVLALEEDNGVQATAHPIWILSAVPKGRLFDDSVRKMNEIGVSRLTPLDCDRSVVVPGDGKIDRWRKVATASVRQCGRQTPITVDAPMSVFQALTAVQDWSSAMMDVSADVSITNFLAAESIDQMAVFVGPEGGFTSREVEAARDAGVVPCRFGPLVFRTETAAIVAAVVAAMAVDGLNNPSV